MLKQTDGRHVHMIITCIVLMSRTIMFIVKYHDFIHQKLDTVSHQLLPVKFKIVETNTNEIPSTKSIIISWV